MKKPAPSISPTPVIGSDPYWYKNAVIYEIPIRAYCDSNADGIGDINGVISKLDYLSELGITAIWLLPFYPSPLRDGGYDISDYTSVHSMYGTLDDFKRLLEEAHNRGIRIITELVINHTSKEHPWFERARTSPKGSKWRDFYVWSDTDTLYKETRIIFRDFEASNWTWDPVAGSFYWHRFYSHQPDLNFDNPDVHKAVLDALDFWFDLGVDGLRLDAIPYLYERDGTNCENLPETHQFLKKLRSHVDSKYADRMLLAEANQWPEDAVAYFGDGDECHMNFHFPLMPRMFMAVQLEDQFPIVDILRQTPDVPDNCQWATFLRNHDELTLEMVTDEDRDYMYRAYAHDPTARLNLGIRRRLAPLLGTRQKIELMNGLLFSLPGTPVMYYGDEIGMGDNIYLGDRDGVRTPMQWSADRNAGFSEGNPQRLFLPVITDPEYRHEAVNVQSQENNPASLLWWMKRTIALRKQHPALSSGKLEILPSENSKILAFVRVLEEERVLVVANLSRFHQCVELELQNLAGLTPVEMSGVVPFPKIGDSPYRLTVAPFGFLWFLLEPPTVAAYNPTAMPRLSVKESWSELWAQSHRAPLEKALAPWASERRWFRGKGRRRRAGHITDVLTVAGTTNHALLVFEFEFTEGEPQSYLIPVTVLLGDELLEVERQSAPAIIAYLDGLGQPAAIMDSMLGSQGAPFLLSLFRPQAVARGVGSTACSALPELTKLLSEGAPEPKLLQLEQSNSTVIFGDKLMLKLYRQLEYGVNSELQIGEFLANHSAPAPRTLGGLNYQTPESPGAAVIALVQEFVPNQGTAWDMTLDRIGSFFDRVLSSQPSLALPPPQQQTWLARSRSSPTELAWDLLGNSLGAARKLGTRTAEVHIALASERHSAAFAPEPFTVMHQQSIYQWTRARAVRTFESLRKKRASLPAQSGAAVEALLSREEELMKQLRTISTVKIDAERIRCHGDLHLGQVLHTGDDFIVIDFEGEPARPLNERSYKRSPLRDVVGMIRSFNYATESVMRGGRYREQDVQRLIPWARYWEEQVCAEYLDGYLETAKGQPFVPPEEAHIELLLNFFTLEKAVYEIGYEMNNRPEWLPIPVAGLLGVLDSEGNHV